MTSVQEIKRQTYVSAWIVWAVATVVIFRASLEAVYALADIVDPAIANSGFKTWSFNIVRICVVIGSPVVGWLISYRLLFRQLNPIKMLGWMYALGTMFTVFLGLSVVFTWPWQRMKYGYPALEYDVLVGTLGLTMMAVMVTIRFLAKRAVRQTENKTL